METKPNLCLIPSAYKASKVYSVLPSDGVGDFDFSRSGEATRVNKDGLIELVGSNIPRLNYPMIDGVVSGCPSLLLEPQRTNLFIYSESFENSFWSKFGTSFSVTDNNSISPYGTLNASTLNVSNTNNVLYNSISFSATNAAWTFSIYAKGSGSFNMNIRLSGNVDTTKTITLTSYWQRFDVTSISGTSITSVETFLELNNIVNIDIFGAQLEQDSYPTSYIKSNSGSITTRSAETCNGAGDAATFNDSEGVLMVEISALADGGSTRRWSISDGSYSNRITLELDEASNTLKAFVISADTTSYSPSEVLSDITNYNKVAIKYKQNDFALWINGFEFDVDNSGDTPINLSKMQFADGNGTDAPFYGKTKQLQYFDTALTDTDLEELTSWTSFNEMAISQQYSLY